MKKALLPITAELVADLIPLPDHCEAVAVGTDLDSVVFVLLQGEALPDKYRTTEGAGLLPVSMFLRVDEKPCGCRQVEFDRFE